MTKTLVTRRVDYLKLPLEAVMLIRPVPHAVQDKLSSVRSVLQAGRELAATGKFHPDGDPAGYNGSIRQDAAWNKIEGWGEDGFGEVFVEKTKQNAFANRVKWAKQVEQSVQALVSGWRDISKVLDDAAKGTNQPPALGSGSQR